MTTQKLNESMMREMFNVADTNKDNTLSLTEFETFLEQQGGVRVEHMRVKSMFDEMTQGTSRLAYKDFKSFLTSMTNMKKTTLKRQISGSAIPQNSESILAKSVVQIWTAACNQSYLTPWVVQPVRNCTGTGFIVDSEKRYIITNEHVIRNHVRLLPLLLFLD